MLWVSALMVATVDIQGTYRELNTTYASAAATVNPEAISPT